eukprot:6143762-Prorocentrum_lima.AAC.1
MPESRLKENQVANTFLFLPSLLTLSFPLSLPTQHLNTKDKERKDTTNTQSTQNKSASQAQ